MEMVPPDGSRVGNRALFRAVEESLAAEGVAYDGDAVNAVREQLIADGVLGPVAVSYGAALPPKIVPAKAQCAGPGRSKAKRCNAGWRDFGRNPSGRGHFSAILRCRSLM
jgi:hypothetical protein